MTELKIVMPDEMNAYVAERVADGAYADAGDFIRELVRQDREKRELSVDALRRLLDEAEESGISSRTIPEIMADVKVKLQADGRL